MRPVNLVGLQPLTGLRRETYYLLIYRDLLVKRLINLRKLLSIREIGCFLSAAI